MKQIRSMMRHIRLAAWCMLLAGIMGICGNEVLAEAETYYDYGSLVIYGECGEAGSNH